MLALLALLVLVLVLVVLLLMLFMLCFAVGYSLMCLSALAIAVLCVSLWRRAAAAGAMCEV